MISRTICLELALKASSNNEHDRKINDHISNHNLDNQRNVCITSFLFLGRFLLLLHSYPINYQLNRWVFNFYSNGAAAPLHHNSSIAFVYINLLYNYGTSQRSGERRGPDAKTLNAFPFTKNRINFLNNYSGNSGNTSVMN